MALQKGDVAPDFTLLHKGSDGLSKVTLSDHRGETVILLFFPIAGTGVCTKEMCMVTEDWAAYTATGAKVFAISVDNPFAQEIWAGANGISVPLLSDFNNDAIDAYGINDDDFALDGIVQQGIAKRSAFVIDADGVVQHAEVLENPGELPDLAKVKAAVAE